MFVCQLPYPDVKRLSAILDVDDKWEEIAISMNLTVEEVALIRRAQLSGGSPTQLLIRYIGKKGAKTIKLFDMIHKVQYNQALEILAPHVDVPRRQLLESDKPKAILPTVKESSSGDHVGLSQPSTSDATNEAPQPIHSGSQKPQVAVGSPNDPTVPSVPQSTFELHNSPPAPCSPGVHNLKSGVDVSVALQVSMAIPYEELADATQHFATTTILGRGGFGIVFKGCWKETLVAIKRISCDSDDEGSSEEAKEQLRQSLVELRTLAVYRHDNVLPLYGYSLDGKFPCLVYQFMANGSLDDRLRCKAHTSCLSWRLRLNIGADSARGINFLHTCNAKEPLIHGDIKSANILLDSNFSAKIGDFGLARKGTTENSHSPSDPNTSSSIVRGTFAYLPPESIRHKRMTTKMDIYSFGVVLGEIMTGFKAFTTHSKYQFLTDFLRQKYTTWPPPSTKQLSQEPQPSQHKAVGKSKSSHVILLDTERRKYVEESYGPGIANNSLRSQSCAQTLPQHDIAALLDPNLKTVDAQSFTEMFALSLRATSVDPNQRPTMLQIYETIEVLRL